MAGTLTQLGTGSTLADSITKQYDNRALDNLRANLHFVQLCGHRSQDGMKGLTQNVFSYRALTDVTAAATEGTVPSTTGFSAATAEITAAQYIQWVALSDIVINQHRADAVKGAADELGYRMGSVLDTVARNEFVASATGYFANNETYLSTVASGDTLEAADLRILLAKLRNNNARPLMGDDYGLVLHPFQTLDLQADSAVGGWLDVSKYTANGTKALTGEIGKLWGFRIVQTSKVGTAATADTSGGATVYQGVASAKDAVLDLDLTKMKPQIIRKGLGTAGTADPANQIASVAYKAMYGVEYVSAIVGEGARAYCVQTAASVNS